MAYRVFNFVFASAATTSNKQYVGPHARAVLVLSAMTGWNAGTTNASVSVRCGLSATDTHVDVTSGNVSTMSIKGLYNVPVTATTPWMSIGFGTAVTGSATNSCDVIVFSNTSDI
jgi:hypothetical protein